MIQEPILFEVVSLFIINAYRAKFQHACSTTYMTDLEIIFQDFCSEVSYLNCLIDFLSSPIFI
jgi:hypothetical protein